jgi:large subunit ribosomal protein L23Ae
MVGVTKKKSNRNDKQRTGTKFRRPKTLKIARNPRFPKSFTRKNYDNKFLKIIKYPITTESALKKIQSSNTLVFMVDNMANKFEIKHAIKKIYKAKIIKINTLITLKGKKKAFVKLSEDCDALDVANKIGFI